MHQVQRKPDTPPPHRLRVKLFYYTYLVACGALFGAMLFYGATR